MVDLGLQDEKVELGHVQAEGQDVQVEDEEEEESLEETLDGLATLEMKKFTLHSDELECVVCNCDCEDASEDESVCCPRGSLTGFICPRWLLLRDAMGFIYP